MFPTARAQLCGLPCRSGSPGTGLLSRAVTSTPGGLMASASISVVHIVVGLFPARTPCISEVLSAATAPDCDGWRTYSVSKCVIHRRPRVLHGLGASVSAPKDLQLRSSGCL